MKGMYFNLVLMWIIGSVAYGQATVYPENANIIDVTKAPYFADNTGVLDATAIINQALLDHNDQHAIIYLPKGTYRVTDQITWGSPPGCESGTTYTCHRYTILAGQGIDSTILKLDDNAPLYQDSLNPQLMIWTDKSAAMSFENSVRNLTINTGRGNPGTHALGFEANNQGGIFNVKIKSEDGRGVIGLHMGTGDQAGPCLIKNLEVDGFKWGIYTFANQNSIYLEDIFLKNQTEFGLYNRQQMLSIKDLHSINEVPAIYNHPDGGSMVTMINSLLEGIGGASGEIAFRNNNLREIYLRDVQVSGYNYALQQLQNGFSLEIIDTGYIDEYTTHAPDRICDNVLSALKLPIEEVPLIPYEDTSKWVSITDYGAAIDNGFQGKGSPQDDSQAIQQAMNSDSATILFPGPLGQFPQRFLCYDTINIPSTVKRIIGSKALINGGVVFNILPGNDTLIIEDFAKFGDIIHKSGRTLVLTHLGLGSYSSSTDGTSGNVYIEDVVGGPYYFNNQQVWARQCNVEKDSINITNDGGQLWVFGMKTEKKGTAIRTINGGRTEVLGGLYYGTLPDESIPKPIFIVEESDFSISTFKELGYINDAWDIKVREIRNGKVNEYIIGNSAIRSDLFVSYVSDSVNVAPTVDAGPDQVLLLPMDSTYFEGKSNDDGLPSGDCYTSRNWVQIAGPPGVIIHDQSNIGSKVSFSSSGKYCFSLGVSDGVFTVRDTVTIEVYDVESDTYDHDGDGIESGAGADANLRGWSNYLKNYGGTNSFGPRHYNQFPAKSIIRIDRSAYDTLLSENVRLELELATTNGGLIEDWTYNIFGLNDGHVGEHWIEGSGTGQELMNGEVNYDNAPGFSSPFGGAYDPADLTSGGVDHLQATFLGTINTRKGKREKVGFSSDRLREFVNSDTSGTLTFLITRASFALNTIVFASKEHASFAPPALYLDGCPEANAWYIDPLAQGTGYGDSWVNAMTSLQEALAHPCISIVDTIFMAEGVYIPDTTDRNFSYLIDQTLHIEGGYQSGTGVFDPSIYQTILSGNIGDLNLDSDNLFEVLTVKEPGGILSVKGVVVEF